VSRRVRILSSDGDARTSRVINDTTGDEIPKVQSVTWTCDVGDNMVAHADIRIVMAKADVVADATITEVCPYCGYEKGQV
jgi:hypothetical protein